MQLSLPIWFASIHRAGKTDGENLFDEIDPSAVNTHLQGLMEGLTIKVMLNTDHLELACLFQDQRMLTWIGGLRVHRCFARTTPPSH